MSMDEKGILKPQHRVLLLIPAIPGLFFIAFQLWSFYLEGTNAEFSFLFGTYGMVSLYIIWHVITGKAPKFLSDD
jgi:hypothetical protein